MALTASARRFATWTALLAVLAAALMPALSHAFAPGKDATKWIEVCSTAGPMTIEVPANGPGFPKAPKASDFEHCPCCSLQAAAPAILPTEISLPPAPAETTAASPPASPAPQPSLSWLAAAPRAPPRAD